MRIRDLKWRFSVVGLLAALALNACGPQDLELAQDVDSGEFDATTEPITWVDQSKVERQSIGNCWLYSTASWLESLNKAATGVELNTSQSFTTYWHWFDQIANDGYRNSISTGGTYDVAVEIYTRYGVMLEKDFIPEEATSEMSARQAAALDAINLSLKSGALSTREARRDRELVRAELDRAWKLNKETVLLLNRVFGRGVVRTLDRAYLTRKPPSVLLADGSRIRVHRTVDIPVLARDSRNGQFSQVTLADAIGERSGFYGSRTGPFAWREVNYPYSTTARREFQRRVQRALHDHQPVIMAWFVDFNAMGRDGTFTLERLKASGPGSQGGHMVVMHDYEVENVPGFGTLEAGVNETRPEALEAALDPAARIKFIRIKNSWGAYRPDRWDDAAIPGYHDLYVDYLNGPIARCAQKADGSTDTTNCKQTQTPFWDVVLPAGY